MKKDDIKQCRSFEFVIIVQQLKEKIKKVGGEEKRKR